MSKQTATEWLFAHLLPFLEFSDPKEREHFRKCLAEAKAMEKGQSISDYCEGFMSSGEGWNGEYGLGDGLDVAGEIGAEDYFNKTYGGDK
jgi:hypothetical protein